MMVRPSTAMRMRAPSFTSAPVHFSGARGGDTDGSVRDEIKSAVLPEICDAGADPGVLAKYDT